MSSYIKSIDPNHMVSIGMEARPSASPLSRLLSLSCAARVPPCLPDTAIRSCPHALRLRVSTAPAPRTASRRTPTTPPAPVRAPPALPLVVSSRSRRSVSCFLLTRPALPLLPPPHRHRLRPQPPPALRGLHNHPRLDRPVALLRRELPQHVVPPVASEPHPGVHGTRRVCGHTPADTTHPLEGKLPLTSPSACSACHRHRNPTARARLARPLRPHAHHRRCCRFLPPA